MNEGDVVALMTGSGTVWARYTYDAWGKQLQVLNGENKPLGSTSDYFANANPFRYRGYYCDVETGFYYLQSRYYDPSIGRFINADAAEYSTLTAINISETNLFVYCKNNPITNFDPSGHRLISLVVMRLIHNAVAKSVAQKVAGSQNVFIKKTTTSGTVKRGFLDVYISQENSYYEIKSEAQKNTSRTIKQMEKYDGSIAVNFNSGPISREKQYVAGSFQYLYYDVKYWTERDGLVLYSATENAERKKAYERTAEGIASLAVVSIFASFGIPLPAVI